MQSVPVLFADNLLGEVCSGSTLFIPSSDKKRERLLGAIFLFALVLQSLKFWTVSFYPPCGKECAQNEPCGALYLERINLWKISGYEFHYCL